MTDLEKYQKARIEALERELSEIKGAIRELVEQYEKEV